MEYNTLLGLVFAAAVGLSAAQTKYCCAPPQWEGILVTTANHGGKIGQITTTAYVFNDYTNQRTAVFLNATQSSGQQFSFEILTIFNVSSNTGKVYILNLKTKYCSAQDTNSPITKFCVPDSALKLGDVTLGADSESLPVSVFFNIAGGQHVTLTMTRKLCIPVTQTITSDEKQGSYMNVAGFANIRTSISQPSAFTVPPECREDNLMFIPEAGFELQFASMPPNMFSIKMPFF